MRGWVIRGEFFLLPKEIASVDKPAEDQSVTALKGLIKKPENPIRPYSRRCETGEQILRSGRKCQETGN